MNKDIIEMRKEINKLYFIFDEYQIKKMYAQYFCGILHNYNDRKEEYMEDELLKIEEELDLPRFDRDKKEYEERIQARYHKMNELEKILHEKNITLSNDEQLKKELEETILHLKDHIVKYDKEVKELQNNPKYKPEGKFTFKKILYINIYKRELIIHANSKYLQRLKNEATDVLIKNEQLEKLLL